MERTINLDLVGSWDKKKDGDIGRLDSSFLHNTRIEHMLVQEGKKSDFIHDWKAVYFHLSF